MRAPPVLARLLDSPIVARESLARARSRTMPLGISLYVCLLGGFALVMFSLAISGAPNRRPDAADMADAVFLTMAFQLALAVLFAPALAVGSIAGERERGTLDMLLLGRLGPLQIVWGKLVSSVSYLVLLIVASLPVAVAVFLYAGLGVGRLLLTELVTVATAVALASIAVGLSAVLPRTATATATAYGVVMVLYVGTALIGVIPALDEDTARSATSVHPLLFANPLYAVHALATATGPAGADLGRLVQLLFFGGGEAKTWGPTIQPWQASVLAQLALSALCLWVGARVLAGRRVLPRNVELSWPRRRPGPAPSAPAEAP